MIFIQTTWYYVSEESVVVEVDTEFGGAFCIFTSSPFCTSSSEPFLFRGTKWFVPNKLIMEHIFCWGPNTKQKSATNGLWKWLNQEKEKKNWISWTINFLKSSIYADLVKLIHCLTLDDLSLTSAVISISWTKLEEQRLSKRRAAFYSSLPDEIHRPMQLGSRKSVSGCWIYPI